MAAAPDDPSHPLPPDPNDDPIREPVRDEIEPSIGDSIRRPPHAAVKPVFLLADSQLLFWREEDGRPFLDRVRHLLAQDLPSRPWRAAYFGAANGDAREFYDLFVAAMETIGIRDTRHIGARPTTSDLAYAEAADLLLFAGGDVRRGWDSFTANGLPERIFARYFEGALLIGVSAGAVQLGLTALDEKSDRLFDTFRVVPFVVDVHDEPSWSRLASTVPRAGEHARAIGIPAGGGAIYHPEYALEPIRHPVVEMSRGEGGALHTSLLLPAALGPAESTS